MAGSRQGKAAGRTCLLTGLLLLTAAAAGAQTPPRVPIARECQINNGQTATDSPLPNVAAALKRSKRIRILAIGASSSAGPGASRGGYHAVLRRLLERSVAGVDVQIVHRGVSGELAAQAADRLKLEVGLTAPDLVLWQVGTNDALAYVPVDEVQQTVTDTVRWLKDHKVDVVLVGLQFAAGMARDSHYQAIRVALRRIAQKENVIIVRRYEAMETLAKLHRTDPTAAPNEFEENEAAYSCMAQYVARAISVSLFGRDLPRLAPPQVP
ncbi:MAG: SGNH/GDSL hydrolase family protein [Rhodospirillaceae bacterium]|nr:SGNH/GDSL hydrolase family protein [Rhodospirillaceae bacterium]